MYGTFQGGRTSAGSSCQGKERGSLAKMRWFRACFSLTERAALVDRLMVPWWLWRAKVRHLHGDGTHDTSPMHEADPMTRSDREVDARIAIDDLLRAADWDPRDKSQIGSEVVAEASGRPPQLANRAE